MIPMHILEPAFTLMGDVARHTPSTETIEWYVEEWSAQRLQPAAILQAVKERMADWNSGRWPGPALIAARARQIMRDDDDLMAGQAHTANRLHDLCEITGQERWDDRRNRARTWIATHRDLLPAIEAEVDATGRTHIDRFGLKDALVSRMGAAFREGALIGVCLELERIEHTQRGKARIAELRERARALTAPQQVAA
jgi:hypothetical protein